MNCQVDLLLDEVTYGQTRRFDCPACRGKGSFAVSNLGLQISFQCFRMGCNLRGHKKIRAEAEDVVKRLSNRVSSSVVPFALPTYCMNGISSIKCLRTLAKYHCLEPYRNGLFSIAYDPKQDRLVIMVKKGGKVVGAVGRTLSNQKPKTINYPGSDAYPLIVGKGSVGVVVEDALSACALSQHDRVKGIAMMGTEMKDEYIEALQEFSAVYVAVDPDAKVKGLDIVKILRYYHPNVNLLLIPKDIKNMEVTEVKELIDGIC